MGYRLGLGALWLVGAAVATEAMADGGIELRVRDSHRGTGVTTRVWLTAEDGSVQRFDSSGSGDAEFVLSAGRWTLDLDADGYRRVSTDQLVHSGADLAVTVWLDPLVVPEPCRASGVADRLESGRMLLHGHVVDGRTGRTVAGAVVRTDRGGPIEWSDDGGSFELLVPLSASGPDEPPRSAALVVELSGYRTHRERGLPLVEGDTHLIIELQPGSADPVDERDGTHKLSSTRERPTQVRPPGLQVSPQAESNVDRRRIGAPDELQRLAIAAVSAPPASIRVGFNCSCRNCGTIEVMSLETYVKRGLNDEWISSWPQDSLRAGAIPYRSYGVWHVNNPIDANYDICSTTCCQVNDADTASNSDLAVDRTPGILLESSGSIVRSEYSAENNGWDDPNDGLSCSNADLSCGDGFAGSPSTGWPCLADSLGSGHGCFGHGRGMCQWGTQRWAGTQGQLWNWIVDHYYNDDDNPAGLRSAYMTSPLQIVTSSPAPSGVEAGATLQLDLDADNLAALDHTQVLIGASLWSASTGYIDDPLNDQPVSLVPGSNMVSRVFTVPAGTPEQSYDLVTALWIDVNENGSISGLDEPMMTHTSPGAVEVCSDPVAVADSLRLERIGVDSVELTWAAAPNGTSYNVYRSPSALSGWASLATPSGTSFTDPAATADLLFYEVAARNACGESAF